MKVSYVSDIHGDFHSPFHKSQEKWEKHTKEFINKLIETDEGDKEVLIIAGDISHFNRQTIWILESFAEHYNKIFMIYGNHCMYLVSKNQESKYKNNSMNRIIELKNMIESSPSLTNVFFFTGQEAPQIYKGVRFYGNPLWYPLETIHQKMFFSNISNDSNLIKGVNIQELHEQNINHYNYWIEQTGWDVVFSHFPVINIDSHEKYNSTACYLTRVKDMTGQAHIFGHSHEQKVYEKPYGTFYMNAIGYPEEQLEMKIRHFEVNK